MKNEVAAVVGVGPGLGAALVKRFAKEGFTTIAVARGASSLTSLRGGDAPVILYDCDATVPEQVERLFEKIQSDYGQLCITVFNAGAFERREGAVPVSSTWLPPNSACAPSPKAWRASSVLTGSMWRT